MIWFLYANQLVMVWNSVPLVTVLVKWGLVTAVISHVTALIKAMNGSKSTHCYAISTQSICTSQLLTVMHINNLHGPLDSSRISFWQKHIGLHVSRQTRAEWLNPLTPRCQKELCARQNRKEKWSGKQQIDSVDLLMQCKE